jgi:hypothetical protein
VITEEQAMQGLQNLATIVAVLAIAGCAAHTGAVPGAVAGPQGKTAAPSPDDRLVDDVTRALKADDAAGAGVAIERARTAAPPARPGAEILAYYDATVHAYRGDYRGAAAILYAYAAEVGPSARAAFAFHDAMIALRTAEGDLLGALVECEEMTRAGALGTWGSPGDDRMTTVRLKEHWHRAYLLRMIAETVTGAERDAFLGYAERARQAYVALARPLAETADSIAVLDAYFAYCAGDRAKMREAALRVNVKDDDDVEDLYLVQLALDGAGDREAAAAVRRRILASAPVTVLTPQFLMWIHGDDGPADQPRQFSPRFPTGARLPPRS